MMSRPQVENGYTRIANELLEAMLCADLSGREWKVIMAIARKTYGYQKKADQMSYGQISEKTKIARQHVVTICGVLEKRQMIMVTRSAESNCFAIQKDYTRWLPSPAHGSTKKAKLVSAQDNSGEDSPAHGTSEEPASPVEGTSNNYNHASQKDLREADNVKASPAHGSTLVPPTGAGVVPSTGPTKEINTNLSLRERLSRSKNQPELPNMPTPPEGEGEECQRPDPRVKRLREYFAQEYERRFKSTYLPAFARDGKIFKDILAGLQGMNGEAEGHVKTLIQRYFAPDHKFMGNVDVPSFLGAFNRLAAEKPKPATDPPRPAILDRPAPTEEQWAAGTQRVREVLKAIGGAECQTKKEENSNPC